MTVHLSLVVVLAGIVWLLLHKGKLKIGHAIAAILLGFYLQDSSLAPSIDRAAQSIADAISSLHL
ncbi:hypothetical protein ACTPOK_09160 [Streptomyces inhibens]|uniref:hypothetical protein n=1 Tax=Streptomyces inhibens TaxID=2293571 RepID=UPI00402AFB2A